jgi:hypothetical protein
MFILHIHLINLMFIMPMMVKNCKRVSMRLTDAMICNDVCTVWLLPPASAALLAAVLMMMISAAAM